MGRRNEPPTLPRKNQPPREQILAIRRRPCDDPIIAFLFFARSALCNMAHRAIQGHGEIDRFRDTARAVNSTYVMGKN